MVEEDNEIGTQLLPRPRTSEASDDGDGIEGVAHFATPTTRRRVGITGLLALGFFWVSGGIFGNEALLLAGPPAYVFVCLLIAPVLYALPVAVMIGELGAALPYDGGLVAWVAEACGSAVGAQTVWWLWVATILDSAIYPILAAHYLSRRVDLSSLRPEGAPIQTETRLVATALIGLITTVKLGGINCMVRMTEALVVIAIIPVLVFVGCGLSTLDGPALTNSDTSDEVGGYDPALLTSWVLWLYSGFFSLGSLAGEVDNPRRVYPIVTLSLIPTVALFCIAPLAVSVSIDSNRTHYHAGHFDSIATSLVGDWLGVSFVVAACLSQIGLFNGDMVVAERSMASVFDTYIHGEDAQWGMTRYLLIENGTGVAPIYIVFNAIVSAMLTWFSYEDLIQFQMMQSAVSSP